MKNRKYVALMAVTLIVLSTSVFASGPAKAQLPFSVDEVWKRAVQTFALEHIRVTSSDEGTGILQGTGSFAGQPGLFNCEKGAGILDKEEYNVTVVINKTGDSTTTINVQSVAKTTWHQHKKILFVNAGNVFNYATCTSTGELEKTLVQRLSTP